MQTVTIEGVEFEFDETLPYNEFHLDRGNPQFLSMDMSGILELTASGELPYEVSYFRHLSRWVYAAPRKRNLRAMRASGMNVLTTEMLFDGWEQADAFIDGLENTGLLAARLLEATGHKPFGPNWIREEGLSEEG